jgi:crossover junction endodeoxyribonuclease RusA
MVESSPKVRPWWQAVSGATHDAIPDDWEPLTGPVQVDIVFYLARPRYHYGTGKNANRLKPTAPSYCDKKPDADKLQRTVLDALKASGVYVDDSQVADVHAVKRYADSATGARITITPLTDPAPAAEERSAAGAATRTEGALF